MRTQQVFAIVPRKSTPWRMSKTWRLWPTVTRVEEGGFYITHSENVFQHLHSTLSIYLFPLFLSSVWKQEFPSQEIFPLWWYESLALLALAFHLCICWVLFLAAFPLSPLLMNYWAPLNAPTHCPMLNLAKAIIMRVRSFLHSTITSIYPFLNSMRDYR